MHGAPIFKSVLSSFEHAIVLICCRHIHRVHYYSVNYRTVSTRHRALMSLPGTFLDIHIEKRLK
jgi:hypothetical protein